MGLFDEIVCEYPLPDGWVPPPGTLFQTKDFDQPYLDKYRIDADGVLWGQGFRYEDRSDPNATGFMALAGCRTRIPTGESRVYHHGALCFYTGEVEYVALFDHGKLLKIESEKDVPRG